MKVQAFYTAGPGFISRTIIRIAQALFAHIGLLFTATKEEFEKLKKILPDFHWDEIHPDGNGNYRFFFESIWKKDERTGKTGVRGPYPFLKLIRWKGVEQNKTLELQDLPLSSEQAFDMIPFLCNAVIEIKYAPRQLYFNWQGIRLGVGIPFKKRTPNKWTCIETVTRVIAYVAPEFAIMILKMGEFTYEEIPPSSKSKTVPGFFEIIERYRKDNA